MTASGITLPCTFLLIMQGAVMGEYLLDQQYPSEQCLPDRSVAEMYMALGGMDVEGPVLPFSSEQEPLQASACCALDLYACSTFVHAWVSCTFGCFVCGCHVCCTLDMWPVSLRASREAGVPLRIRGTPR